MLYAFQGLDVAAKEPRTLTQHEVVVKLWSQLQDFSSVAVMSRAALFLHCWIRLSSVCLHQEGEVARTSKEAGWLWSLQTFTGNERIFLIPVFGKTQLIEPSASGDLGFYLHEISTFLSIRGGQTFWIRDIDFENLRARSGPDAFLSKINILLMFILTIH